MQKFEYIIEPKLIQNLNIFVLIFIMWVRLGGNERRQRQQQCNVLPDEWASAATCFFFIWPIIILNAFTLNVLNADDCKSISIPYKW